MQRGCQTAFHLMEQEALPNKFVKSNWMQSSLYYFKIIYGSPHLVTIIGAGNWIVKQSSC